mgnify:CR=1 FL=1
MTSVETNLLQRVMTRALEWFLIFLMIVLTAVVVIAVLYRISGDSLSWYDEVAAVLLSWVTYYGACLAALERKHIGVDSVLLIDHAYWRYCLICSRLIAFMSLPVLNALCHCTIFSMDCFNCHFGTQPNC